jgi:hypothetical protein
MPFVSGFLRIRRGGHPDQGLPGVEGPVDPGYGVDEGGHPDQGLPGGEGPVDPGYGIPLPPVTPGHPLPPTGERPSHPIARPPRPTYPVDPDYGLPTPPTVWPHPPRPVDPNYGIDVPVSPEHPIYRPGGGGGTAEQLPVLPPGAVYPPLPPGVTGKLTVFCWIVGVGYRWTTIDCSLKPTHPIYPPHTVPGHPDQGLPPVPGHPDQGLPPEAQPKRG